MTSIPHTNGWKYIPLLAFFLFLFAPGTLVAQSAETVLNRALDRHEAMLEDVQDCTVIQMQEGPAGATSRDTLYLEKQIVDGRPQLLPPGSKEEQETLDFLYEVPKERARYSGTSAVDGHETHVLVIDDPEALEKWLSDLRGPEGSVPESPENVTIQSVRAHFDAESYVARKTVVDLEVSRNGETFPIQQEMMNSDYREVNGLLYPFHRVTRFLGLTGGMTPEELRKAREQLQKFEQKLEEMEPAKRKMVKNYMGDKLDKWRKMLESGSVETVTGVVELRVNQGVPNR
ncbi:MAG: hypothetical protein V5A20_08020 [Salinibacter sp.]|uniref:hypothetical protein n=1 Tax=Salinibacter sp. TaxID=2065818 RepID=UPI002FC38CF4